MLVSKRELEEYLIRIFNRIVFEEDKCQQIYDYVTETYDLPKVIAADYIATRRYLSEASEYELFILLDALNSIENKKKYNVSNYYTEQEIKYYSHTKYKSEKIKFPLVFKMIQVEGDQWIGKIDMNMLKKLRRAQLINYNVNAQRTMQRIIKGDKSIYKITLNNKAVKSIAESLKDGNFIPNTITLNIPLETEYDFYYDEEEMSLVIKNLEHFDITDAYHRLMALYQISDLNDSFTYNMELRIVNFSEDKARQFIYQEDQKTQMKKIDSDSMNTNHPSNIVVTRLNENIRSNFKGLISRNDGIIRFGELSNLVNYFYFSNTKKSNERSQIIKAVSELTEDFNILSEYNIRYLEEKMSYRTLLAAMVVFQHYRENNLDKTNICEVIEKTAQAIMDSNNNKFVTQLPRKGIINEVKVFMEKVLEEGDM